MKKHTLTTNEAWELDKAREILEKLLNEHCGDKNLKLYRKISKAYDKVSGLVMEALAE